MIRECYENVCAGIEVRKNLIALRSALHGANEKRSFAYCLAGDFSLLYKLLKHEDPKVRKNAALILGEMESEDVLPVLFDAYRKEQTRFVRADYLQAISKLDYHEYLDRLKEAWAELKQQKCLPEEQKHRAEELRALQQMILEYEKPARHEFTGYQYNGDVVLTTNRCQREATAAQIKEGTVTLLQGGMRINGEELRKMLPIRTYTELLFPIGVIRPETDRPEELGRLLAGEKLRKFVSQMHEGQPPFYYRIELKSGLPQEKKGAFIRKLSESFEGAAAGVWMNTTSDYELEIRLIQRKDDSYLVMVKLYTIPDTRFAYRREVVAASVAPANAALTVQLAHAYLKQDAQILDPFCGVGTMLIERNLAVKAGSIYGIDIYGEAIEKARINTAVTGMRINYINKDFFEFTHEYLFDEIITDMPQVTQAKDQEQIGEVYQRFFAHAGRLLKKKAVMILYTSLPQLVRREVKKYSEYRIAEAFEINERKGTTVFVVDVDRK